MKSLSMQDQDCLAFYIKCAHSRIYSSLAKLFLNAEQLVVFRYTLCSGRSTGLDLAGI